MVTKSETENLSLTTGKIEKEYSFHATAVKFIIVYRVQAGGLRNFNYIQKTKICVNM